MFGKSFELFKLFGFSVKVDLSWLVIAVLVTWSLADGVFAVQYPALSVQTRWAMGAAGAVALFACIVLHELSHSLAARRFGMPMKGITLFIFGGVAEMESEPPSPKAEFVMAIAGPIASVVIALLCFAAAMLGQQAHWPVEINGLLWYLALINAVLVAFNIVPAFPLDGGRVLRSALWQWRGNMRWATKISSQIGSGFGIALIILGVISFIGGDFLGGMWWFLIGMFLRNAAQMSYRQLLMRRALEGEPVRRFMKTDPVTVPASASVRELVEDYIYRHHHKMYPVADNGNFQGCITLRDVREVPRDQWDQRRVGDLAHPCAAENSIDADADAMDALSMLSRTHASRLLVTDHGRLAGVLALKDLVRFLSLKIELDNGNGQDSERAHLDPLD